MTAIVELVLHADPAPWARVGLEISGRTAHVGGVRLRFEGPTLDGETTIGGWGLSDLPAGSTDLASIDGLTTFTAAPSPAVEVADGSGIVGFDHLVVMTSSLERTCAAIEAATGEPLKRIREAGPVRQGFHRLGEVIVEVVESADVAEPVASFWGFVWNVADIHAMCAELGPELIGLPRTAVQPGRFIASFRSGAGLALPIAIMSAPSAPPS